MEAAKDHSEKFGVATIYFYCEAQQRCKLKGSDLLASFIKQLLVYLTKVRKPFPTGVQEDLLKFLWEKLSVLDGVDADGAAKLAPAHHTPTVGELLTHTAGFSYGFDPNDPVDKLYQKNNPMAAASLDEYWPWATFSASTRAICLRTMIALA